ncbi:MAG: hypothetical protein IPN14_10785 [Bacteroidetes bacterium]|nr:hypothetical protein [Bacteroidota bacterium]
MGNLQSEFLNHLLNPRQAFDIYAESIVNLTFNRSHTTFLAVMIEMAEEPKHFFKILI